MRKKENLIENRVCICLQAPEAEFLYEIQDKSLKSFPPCYSESPHLYAALQLDFYFFCTLSMKK
jgi:hypothetical protein